MHQISLKILKTAIGVETNRKELLPSLPFKIEVKSLLTDFNQVEEIPYTSELDGSILIEESNEDLFYEFSSGKAMFKGPVLKLNQEASDLRFSFWGNQGFLYRYTQYLLEKNHRIYNFHACALYNEEKDVLYLIIGGAGSGKTVYLLSGLDKGLKLFSTETVHFRIEEDGISWFLGSLVDNIRFGTLIHDFPQFLPDVDIPEPDKVWQKKIALDLSDYKAGQEQLSNPRSIYILFPRIEQGRKGFLYNPISNKRKAEKALFDNISQKLSETVLLYDKIPILGLDEKELAQRRLENVKNLLRLGSVENMASILSNPIDCWGNLLD